MNGMGIDLSLNAGKLLADTVIRNVSDFSAGALWSYNRDFHILYGGKTAKNEGLKNALLNLPGEGVDFLFKSEVIQASDLAGAGDNTDVGVLLKKFIRGMKKPQYFLKIIGGLIKGGMLAKALQSAPESYDKSDVLKWQEKTLSQTVKVIRK